MQEKLEKSRPKKIKILPFFEAVVNAGIKVVSNVLSKVRPFTACLLACANRPLKLKCPFLFVLVCSCLLFCGSLPIFKSVVVTKLPDCRS